MAFTSERMTRRVNGQLQLNNTYTCFFKTVENPHLIDPLFLSSELQMQAEGTKTTTACILFRFLIVRPGGHFHADERVSLRLYEGSSLQCKFHNLLIMKGYPKHRASRPFKRPASSIKNNG